METRVYIDGYNLYYGCLKGTAFKWLDISSLFKKYVLLESSPFYNANSQCQFKYFTADIVHKAAKDSHSVKDQQTYHRALKALYSEDEFSIIKGYYSVTDTYAPLVDPDEPMLEPRWCNRVKVWKLEEKQTDVNLAVEAVVDALTSESELEMVFVTNDTDICPALAKIKRLTNHKIGVVIPTRHEDRKANKALRENADWVRESIQVEQIARAQLPRVIRSDQKRRLRKPIVKPESWFGAYYELKQIFNVLLPVLGSKSKCWQWLESEKPQVSGLPRLTAKPIDMLQEPAEALKVLEHAKAYVEFKGGSKV